MSINANTIKGFTLIEVVVAVAVIAVGLMGTIKTIGTVTKNTVYLNERVVATWVAQNAMASYELNLEDDAEKETTGTEEVAGIEWHWTKKLVDTQDPGIQRVEIDVRRDDDPDSQVYASLVSLFPAYFY
ncbi:MAG: type II secretion system minor pseudopilin GspI [Gammaproteobacteria bacterium]|nr:type II secretion system minor pseudopilin GspI [Gammaproteobacteria bacterium]